MPKTKSAKKALRQSQKRAKANFKIKTALKITLRKAKPANLSQTFSQIDKAAKRAIISQNKAARLKSRLGRRVNKGK